MLLTHALSLYIVQLVFLSKSMIGMEFKSSGCHVGKNNHINTPTLPAGSWTLLCTDRNCLVALNIDKVYANNALEKIPIQSNTHLSLMLFRHPFECISGAGNDWISAILYKWWDLLHHSYWQRNTFAIPKKTILVFPSINAVSRTMLDPKHLYC